MEAVTSLFFRQLIEQQKPCILYGPINGVPVGYVDGLFIFHLALLLARAIR